MILIAERSTPRMLRALQSVYGAQMTLDRCEGDPEPGEDKERDESDVGVVHEARRDEAGEARDGRRALLEEIVDEIPIARLRTEDPQYALAEQEQPCDLDYGAGDGDQQDFDWHEKAADGKGPTAPRGAQTAA